MSFFSADSAEVIIPPEVGKSRKWLYNLLKEPVPEIPTRQIAGMSDAEKQAQSLLSQYLGTTGMPSGFQTGLTQLTKTVQGEYDPYTSDYWRGLRDTSRMDEEKAVSRLRRGSQASGMFYSGPSERSEAELRSRYGANRQTLLGQLLSEELARRTSAAMPLLQWSDYASQQPLRKATAGMQLGGLGRELSQAEKDAAYQSLLTKIMFPYETQANIANALMNAGPIITKPGGPSEFSKFMDIATGIGKLAAGVMTGGGSLVASGLFSQPQSQGAGLPDVQSRVGTSGTVGLPGYYGF